MRAENCRESELCAAAVKKEEAPGSLAAWARTGQKWRGTKSMEHELRFQENISCWESALPLGNGETGCLIWGSPWHLRFSLDRTDIWDTTPAPGTERPEFTYRNLARLAKEGDNDEIRRIFNNPYKHPLPTKLPAGKIILAFEGYEKTQSCLRLSDGEAELVLESEKAESRRIRSIVHATKGIGMISVDMPRALFSVELQSPEFGRLSDEIGRAHV